SQGIKQEMINSNIDFDINKIDKVINASQDVHKEIRKLIKVISLQSSTYNEFEEELYVEIKSFKSKTIICPSLEIHGEFQDISENTKMNIKCIVKEALTNVIKHSQAANVWVNIEKKDNRIKVIVKDDGIGIKLDMNKMKEEHYGLKFMESRVKELEGKIKFSSDDKGFKIEIEIEG
ncbi:MAG: sensor histidine kinase, partial [Clostridiaceae bacterium]